MHQTHGQDLLEFIVVALVQHLKRYFGFKGGRAPKAAAGLRRAGCIVSSWSQMLDPAIAGEKCQLLGS